jgi:hypothetical protein
LGATPAVGTDLAVNNAFNTKAFTFKAVVTAPDLTKPFVYNSVDMKNNLNADDLVAVAKTNIVIYKTYLPSVGK